MSFDRSNRPFSCKQILNQKDRLRFDSAIQRNQVWKPLGKSLFIHSLLVDIPIPGVYAEEKPDSKDIWFLDGKQRFTTILDFLEDKFALHPDTPPVDEIEIAGLKFSELPEDMQITIYSRNITVYIFKNLTEDERDEMFLRLNGGVPLSRIELTRVSAGSTLRETIQEIASQSFFAQSCNLTPSARNRFADEEVVLQSLLLVYGAGEDINSTAIREFVENEKDSELPMDDIMETVNYLNLAFPEKQKYLRKVNIPVLFKLADEYKEKVLASTFAIAVHKLLSNPTERYQEASSAGSAKAANVKIRIAELRNAIEQEVKSEQQNQIESKTNNNENEVENVA